MATILSRRTRTTAAPAPKAPAPPLMKSAAAPAPVAAPAAAPAPQGVQTGLGGFKVPELSEKTKKDLAAAHAKAQEIGEANWREPGKPWTAFDKSSPEYEILWSENYNKHYKGIGGGWSPKYRDPQQNAQYWRSIVKMNQAGASRRTMLSLPKLFTGG